MVHTFIYDDEYFVLDVETGSIHILDKQAYDEISRLADFEKTADIDKELSGRSDTLALEIKELIKSGLLFSQPQKEEQKSTNIIKAMCLHLAHDCNLRCGYCFAKGNAFGGKRELMSADTAKAAIDFLVNVSGTRRNLEIDFFGGEPLLNFEVLKSTVSYSRSLESKFNKNFRFTVTTNGYKVTDEMKEYLKRNMNNIVVSIDGREHVHDAVRVTAGGKGSYAKVVKNAQELLLDRQSEYYVRGTFTADNLDFSNDVLHLANLGFYGVSIEPVVTKGENAIREEHLGKMFAEYERLAKEYVKRKKSEKEFVFFHFMVDLNAGPCRQKRIRGCGAGTEYIAVAPSGDIYPCHQFVGRPEFLMGNVRKTGLCQNVAKRFDDCNIDNLQKCAQCWAKYYCSGGCAAANLNINGDLYEPYEIGCAMQKKRLELAIGMAAKETEE